MFVFLLTGKRKTTPYHNSKKQSVAIVSDEAGINADELTIRIVEINEKIEQLKNDVPQEPELSFEDAKKIFEDAKKIFEDAKKIFTGVFSVEQQRAILHSLIKKIVLQGDEIQIYWRFE